ncbi:hypothetical protein WI85_16280 [Burkholderia ubonensis]|nr:hypothetical protein WI85_16280 [Burkholderia ubonensis]
MLGLMIWRGLEDFDFLNALVVNFFLLVLLPELFCKSVQVPVAALLLNEIQQPNGALQKVAATFKFTSI